jgi:chemotaxis protein CheX
MMTEASTMSEEVLDSIGELANMVIGNFKTEAENEVGPLALGVPTVVYGRNFRSRSLGTNDWLVLPFLCEGNAFEVRIWFSKAPEPHAAKPSQHGALQVI